MSKKQPKKKRSIRTLNRASRATTKLHKLLNVDKKKK